MLFKNRKSIFKKHSMELQKVGRVMNNDKNQNIKSSHYLVLLYDIQHIFQCGFIALLIRISNYVQFFPIQYNLFFLEL